MYVMYVLRFEGRRSTRDKLLLFLYSIGVIAKKKASL